MTHPGLTFSKTRAEAWEKHASDEDFFLYLDGMKAVYAKRKYKDDGVVDSNLMAKDYAAWQEQRKKDIMKEFTERK